MTLPIERTRAIKHAREFLLAILDPKKTPKIPKSVRKRAREILKHYPYDLHLSFICVNIPALFEEENE